MNERIEEDQELRGAMRMSLVSEEPSEELMRKLRVLAQKEAPQRRWWKQGLAAACTVAAGAAVVALTMVPAKATAKTFENLMAAAQKVHSFQFTIDTSEGGKRSLLTIAGLDGRLGMRTDDGMIMQIDAGSIGIYDPEEKVLTRFKLGRLVDAKTIAEHMKEGMNEGLEKADLKKMLRQYQAKYGKDSIRISPVRHEGGQDIYSVDFQSPKEPERVHMVVDATTDLPNRIVVDEKGTGGAWRPTTTIDMRFGQRVDPQLLSPKFPANVKTTEVDLENLVGDAMKSVEAVAPIVGKFDPHAKEKLKGLRRPGKP